MNHDRPPDCPPTAAAVARRTAVVLTAWAMAAVALGAPAGADGAAGAEVRSAAAPKVVYEGPECLVGHPAAPATKTRNRAKD
jgi:hypothetical protein